MSASHPRPTSRKRARLARRDRPAAALEADERDREDARRALAEWKADPDSAVSIEELARRYGIAL